jgi:hypothetical protein
MQTAKQLLDEPGDILRDVPFDPLSPKVESIRCLEYSSLLVLLFLQLAVCLPQKPILSRLKKYQLRSQIISDRYSSEKECQKICESKKRVSHATNFGLAIYFGV